jgi:hypothetical protein
MKNSEPINLATFFNHKCLAEFFGPGRMYLIIDLETNSLFLISTALKICDIRLTIGASKVSADDYIKI